MERCLDISRVQGRGLDEGEVVGLSERPGLLRGDGSEMAQIWLVADQHDHNVGVGVVTQLPQPPLDVLVGQVFGDIIDQQGTDSTAIVSEKGKQKVCLHFGQPEATNDSFFI